MAVISQ